MGRLNVLKVNDIKGDQTQSINQSPIKLSAICMSPVELPYVPILLDETFTKALWDTGAEKSFISEETYQKYFFYKQVKKSSTRVITAQGAKCRNMGVVELNIRIRYFEKPWLFHVLADLEYPCILGIDFIGGSKIILNFDRNSLAIQESQVEDIQVDDRNLRVDLSETKLNVVANVSDNNRIESIIGEKVNCAIIRDLVLSSRDQLIEEQKTDPELGHIYRYPENPEDSSVNVAICENWSRDFRLVEGLLYYAKYATSLGEIPVYIPKSLRNEFMREFHDKPLAEHFGRFKTYHKIRDVCYFPYMRKRIDQYVSTCHMCQINNYKNALPAGRLIPIVSNYPNEIVTLDLLGPYAVSRVRSYRHRKCDETEIGIGSSDNGSMRDESSGFDRVQCRSNDSRDGKKKGSEVKRELEEKGLSFRNNQGEKHTNKTNKRGPLISDQYLVLGLRKIE
ncbi:uncharacterized protein TNCV_1358321 [Trichonephila clavipes]|uniref:Integrase zinc-binding domain-containing protein n=1 Tax=Trichonephila clavipes TaxID=2585209 RepID=A0A8X6SFT3_TRICX|nr:uncharacterized protein TNCV_1358321 [Trichonephila clavipes]